MKSSSTSEDKGWLVAEHAVAGLQVVLLKKTYVFPWSQLIYAEGTGDEVRAAFATHDLVVRGSGLSLLLEDLAAQRVTQLKEPARTEKFTSGAGPRISELLVRKPDDTG
jgi:hypothetical protein